MHATAEVRGAKVIPRVEESTGDEPGKFTLAVIQMMHATGEVSDTKAMRRAKKSTTTRRALSLMPTASETKHATAEVRRTKVIPRATEPVTSRALSRIW